MEIKHEGVGYRCDKCDYQTKHKCTLKKHIRSEHEGVTYNSNKCNYRAKQKSHLKLHVQSVHEKLNINVLNVNTHYYGEVTSNIVLLQIMKVFHITVASGVLSKQIGNAI